MVDWYISFGRYFQLYSTPPIKQLLSQPTTDFHNPNQTSKETYTRGFVSISFPNILAGFTVFFFSCFSSFSNVSSTVHLSWATRRE